MKPGRNPLSPPSTSIASYLAASAFVIFLLCRAWIVYAPFIGMPWFNMSDENVLAGEVIRFASGDFRQEFMDMPGTPLMGLWAMECRVWYRLSGSPAPNINHFLFARIQQLFQMMRATSLAFYCGSLLLFFLLAARLVGPAPAALACLLVAWNGALGNMITFLRVEPAAMFCVLAALLLLTLPRLRWPFAFAAGAMAGIAAGCRLHSVTLTVPLILMLLSARTGNRSARYSRGMGLALAALAAASIAVLVAAYRACTAVPLPQYRLAHAFLAKASLAAAILIALLLASYFLPTLRRYVAGIVTPESLAAGAGMAIAFCATAFTLFGQWEFFLRSLDFYNGPGYRDPVAATLPLWPKLTSLITFYMGKATPGGFGLLLVIAGTAVILLRSEWRRRLWPFLTVAFGFFFTRSVNLQRASHHIALWVPLFAIVAAAAPAALIGFLESRLPGRRALIHSVALAALLATPFLLTDGAGNGRADMMSSFERLRNVGAAFDWLHANTAPKSEVYTAFSCFGPDTFYGWMRGMNVQVPDTLGTARDFRVWWWDRTALRGRAGYACFVPEIDGPFMKRSETRQKGESVFPAEDPAFQRLQTFGQGRNRVELYRFDLR
jgi:hypothetical protein